MRIGNVNLKNNLLLAPLAGVTDIGFRAIARYFGCALSYTEMVSVNGLDYKNEKSKALLILANNEVPSAVQLFGKDPELFKKVVGSSLLENFDIIDINMGCPVPKIAGKGEGAALMKDIDLAAKIISACTSATDKPVTVKFRKGWSDYNVNAVEFASMCQESGASAVCVHGRTREQFYEGKADWDIIRKVKEKVSIPVIANGDVTDKESYEAILKHTKADAVMIGRGALGRPYIFKEILEDNYKFDMKNLKQMVQFHFRTLIDIFGEHFAVVNMRKHIGWYLKGLRNSAAYRREINTMLSYDEVFETFCKIIDESINNS